MKFEYHYNFSAWSENALELAIVIALITAGTKVILRALDIIFDYFKSRSERRHDRKMREMKIDFEKSKIGPSLYKGSDSDGEFKSKPWIWKFD